MNTPDEEPAHRSRSAQVKPKGLVTVFGGTMDRAHRIGQERSVFAFRLVAEGAVEQAIATLQEKKQALADALLEGPAQGPLDLTQEDPSALFSPAGA